LGVISHSDNGKNVVPALAFKATSFLFKKLYFQIE